MVAGVLSRSRPAAPPMLWQHATLLAAQVPLAEGLYCVGVGVCVCAYACLCFSVCTSVHTSVSVFMCTHEADFCLSLGLGLC